MRRILRKDPLVEVVCEFHLDSPDWDWTVPGVVYGRIKDDFPTKEESPYINFHIEQTPEGVQPSAHASVGRMQFWSKERLQLVQVGPQQFSIHQFRPYSGWPDFKALVEQVLGEYEIAAPFQNIRRMALRYVNRLPFPAEPHKIEHLLYVMPQIPDSIDQLWASWFQQVEIIQPENNAALIVRSGHLPSQAVPTDQGTLAVEEPHMLLDLLFAHHAQTPIARENVSTWLELAHQEIETLFFKSLKPDYLNQFEPEVPNENA